MTRTQACRILGIDEDADRKEVKKKYRKLMHLVHPDAGVAENALYRYTAQEINEAYAVLYKREAVDVPKRSRAAAKKKQQPPQWDAPVNEYAYTVRKIYHYAEGAEGEVLGTFVAAEGKYLWTPEEDFPLFLKSMFTCSKELLDAIDREKGRECLSDGRLAVQGELAYYLAQQFIDGAATLRTLVAPEKIEDASIFSIPAMLELTAGTVRTPAGMPLYPASVRRHRLYLQTEKGQELGYLSFRDDRMYYVIVPLFEQRRVQVKIRIAQKQERKKGRGNYCNLDFWVKIVQGDTGTFPESIQLKIDQLLEQYAERFSQSIFSPR